MLRGVLSLPIRARALVHGETGTVAVLFSLVVLPLLTLTGAALDYGGATSLKSRLQLATDAANVQLCQLPVTTTQSELEAAARTTLASYVDKETFTLEAVTVTASPRQIKVSTSSTFRTAVMKVLNSRLATMNVGATSQCTSEQQTFEIALVLDNTGSMSFSSNGVSKMDALKSAATAFVGRVFDDAKVGPGARISIVPFANSVAVSPGTYKTASWLDLDGRASYHWNIVQGGANAVAPYASSGIRNRLNVYDHFSSAVPSWTWAGCLESRPYPLNVDDSPPVTTNADSYFVPHLAPDESGDGGERSHKDPSNNTVWTYNSYMDDTNSQCAPTTDEGKRTGQICKYLQIKNPKTSNGYNDTSPNATCWSRPLTRLTDSRATLTSEISAMRPNGSTNIHEGFMWGWRTVSPNAPFADGRAYGTSGNNKIVILMTDGENTWRVPSYNPTLKTEYSAYGYFRNPDGTTPANRLMPNTAVPTNGDQARAAMDALALEGCRRARTAGVTIYTIGFSVAGDTIDQQGLDLLKGCAGDASRFFVATDNAAIATVFEQISRDIGKLRLSM